MEWCSFARVFTVNVSVKTICSEATSSFIITLLASCSAGTSGLWCLYKRFVVRVKAPLLCGYKPLVLMLNPCVC